MQHIFLSLASVHNRNIPDPFRHYEKYKLQHSIKKFQS